MRLSLERRIQAGCGAAATLLGLAALLGWQLDVAVLRGAVPGHPAMAPATAVAFALAGLALWLWSDRSASRARRSVVAACASALALGGLVRLAGYLFGWDVGVDRWLLGDRVAAGGGVSPSRMGPNTALSFALAGTALLALQRHGAGARRAVQAAGLLIAWLALLALTGYAYGSVSLYGSMAINTAVALLAVATGLLAAQPDYGVMPLLRSPGAGGVLARRLLPAVVGIPLVLGWLRLAGQRAGLYDDAGGTALYAMVTVTVLFAVASWSALRLGGAQARRREAEAARHESEERYRLLFERNPVPAWVFDVETLRFLAANDAAVQSYGYERDELLAMTIADIRPREDVPALLDRVAGIRAGQPGGGTWRHRKKDGSVIDVEITSHPLTFDGRRAEIVLARDVTEQRRAEDALRASEERFRAVAATANDAIISADSGGRITYFNAAAERIFGYAVSEVTGRELTVLMPERFHDAHHAGLTRYLRTGEAHVVGKTVELVGRRRDGSEFPLDLSLASWRHENAIAFTAILRDVTERRRADEALRRYAAQLEAANAELDAFAYSVSHDLRAPLRAIDGFSQALLEDYQARLDDTGRSHLRRVRAATQQMGVLIDDLLRLSRVTRAEVRRERVDLSAVAETVAAELTRTAPRRQVEFVIAPEVTVEGDPRLLRLVLENLLGNAWKFTAKQPRARIEFGTMEQDGGRAFYVRDDGAGFDMAYAAKLFGAFQRLHSSAEFEGTGVGLATVQRIVHRHGGRVWAEGAVGRGATFYFTM